MQNLQSSPQVLHLARDNPHHKSLLSTIDLSISYSAGRDRSTTVGFEAKRLAPLFSDSDERQVLLVTLPLSAAPIAQSLASAPMGIQNYGRHLAERRVCLTFEPTGVDASIVVDVHDLCDALFAASARKSSLMLVIACGDTAYVRLLDDYLAIAECAAEHAVDGEEDCPAEENEQLHIAFFLADNYKPRRDYSEEELRASFDDYEKSFDLPYDPSLMHFTPSPLWIEFK